MICGTNDLMISVTKLSDFGGVIHSPHLAYFGGENSFMINKIDELFLDVQGRHFSKNGLGTF